MLILIPSIGANGAALAFSSAEIVSLIIMSTYALVKLNDGKAAKTE